MEVDLDALIYQHFVHHMDADLKFFETTIARCVGEAMGCKIESRIDFGDVDIDPKGDDWLGLAEITFWVKRGRLASVTLDISIWRSHPAYEYIFADEEGDREVARGGLNGRMDLLLTPVMKFVAEALNRGVIDAI